MKATTTPSLSNRGVQLHQAKDDDLQHKKWYTDKWGHGVALVVEELCYKPEGHRFDSP
jgi:hypothetical protein